MIIVRCNDEIFRVHCDLITFGNATKQYPDWLKENSTPEEIATDHLTFFTHFLYLKGIASIRLFKMEEVYNYSWEVMEAAIRDTN